MIILLDQKEFRGELEPLHLPDPEPYMPLLWRTVAVVFVLMIALFLNAPIVTSTCVAAAVLLVSRIRPEKLLALDWELLAFFAGLFVITGAIEVTGLSERMVDSVGPVLNDSVPIFSLVTAVLSNLFSNVPAVLLLRPWVPALADPVGGNLTLMGSLNTLIIAEVAKKYDVDLKFMPYLWYGVPITIVTTVLGVLWIMWAR